MRYFIPLLCASALIPADATAARAEDAKRTQNAERTPAARCITENATILRREAPDKDWQIASRDEELLTNDLLVGLPGGMLVSRDGGVRLRFLTALEGQSPFPVKEAAIRLHQSGGVDLDFTLERGRVDLFNDKKAGSATVRLHVRKATWELTLSEPGTRIALELYGRWPRGTHFTAKPTADQAPTAELVFLAIRGHVNLSHQGEVQALHAPPGPALLEWDSVTGEDQSPKRLDALPDWAVAATADQAKLAASRARFARVRELLASKPIDSVFEELLKSDSMDDRRLAINGMAALDRLDLVAKAMREAKTPDIWQNGVLALRHWIGRGPGQDQILYKRLIDNRGFKPVHAATIVQLLHSFGDEDLARPETYQTLLDYLEHDLLAIRGLASWHLERLVPAGKEFGYNPLGSKEEREAALAKWRKLIPAGQMPPNREPKNGNR